MIAKCVGNRGDFLSDEQRIRGESTETDYSLTPGRTYPVVAMFIWERSLCFLSRDDDGQPCFAPAGLFDLGPMRMPEDWFFGLEEGIRASGRALWSSPRVAAWGYRQIVEDPDHLGRLVQNDPEALDIWRTECRRTLE